MRNGHTYVEALLGAFKARAVPVNVNHHYVADEVRHLLADADPRLVVADAAAAALVRDVLGEAGAADLVVVEPPFVAHLERVEPEPRRRDRSPDDTYLLYTGGTTGRPKGVEWRHEDLFFAALGGGNRMGPPIGAPREIVEHLSPASTRVAVASPLMHGTAQWVALSTLLCGGTVVLMTEAAFDPVALWDLVEAERVGQLVVVGDAFAVPLVAALDAEPDRWNLDSLVVVASGGATLSGPIATELLEHLPWAVLVDGYGTTETGGQGRRVLIPGGAPTGPPRFAPEPGTAVIDEHGRPLHPGSPAVGRIARHGNLPLGYRNDPERTAKTFPVHDGRRWALTGDLGRVEADGTITLIGRGERTINSGGEKVDAYEVEHVIRAHPAVVDAMVVGVADRRFGERVGAVVALRSGASLSLDRLVRYCRPSLARFKVPRRLAVVEQLPRLPSGKLDYRRAVELLDPTG
jgi:fatty-acyl-CoA synthase